MKMMYVLGALVVALYGLNVPSLSCLFFIWYSTASASHLAMKFFRGTSHSFSWGFLLFCATFSVIGTVFYYLFAWNIATIAATLLLTPLISYLSKTSPDEPPATALLDEVVAVVSSASPFHWFFSATFLLFVYYTAQFATTESVRTPFEVLPAKFFVILGVLATTFFIYLFSHARAVKPYVAGILLVAFPLLLGSLVVPLGFGFDPFIHITTQEHIALHGEILPKTPYYIGAYLLPTTLSYLSQSLPLIAALDRFIAPLLIALVAFLVARRHTSSPKAAIFSLLTIFLLPFDAFTITTPHALALGFGVLALSTTLSRAPYPVRILFTLASCVMHPLVGGGVALIALILSLTQNRWIVSASLLLPALVLYPAVLLSCVSSCAIPTSLAVPQLPYFTSFVVSFDAILDTLYGALAAIPYLVAVIFLCATFIKRTSEEKQLYRFFLLSLLALVCSSFLVQGITLPNVVSYEGGAFATRMIEIALILSLPLFVQGGAVIFELLTAQKRLARFSYAIIFGLLFTASVFSLYPRHNNVEISRFYSISQNDFDVVDEISHHASSTPYVVLAPQPTSSAALRTFGFTHYKKTADGTEQFLYPIPTGGRLYSFYLSLVNEVIAQETIARSAQFMGVSQVYVVIPAYWFDSARLHQEIADSADEIIEVGTTMIGVYRF